MKRTFSLRTRLFAAMALLVLLQSLALVFALMISQVFLMLDAEAFRLFENTTATRAQAYDASIGRLVGNMALNTQTLSEAMQRTAADAGIAERDLPQSEAYQEAMASGTEVLIALLENNDISGAFFFFADPEAADAVLPGVYLRSPAGGGPIQANTFQLEVGPIAVSQRFTLSTSIRWRIGLSPSEGSGLFQAVYSPIQAAVQYPRAEMERYGYWTTPMDALEDGQRVVSYTMPLLTAEGVPYGVAGVEISLSLFTQVYLPNTDLPYQNSFYSIAPLHDGAIDLSWYIPSGPLAQVYLRHRDSLPLSAVPTTEFSQTQLEGLGDMYCALFPLTMYSRNSPFYAEGGWSLIGFVPQAALHETSSGVRATLLISIGLTTLLAFAAVFVLIFTTTGRISGLSEYVRGIKPNTDLHFSRTGIREIDELTQAVETLNRRVTNASKVTSKILELTLMPIGGYEVSDSSDTVTLTEYIYRLLSLPLGAEVSKAQWARAHDQLVAHPAEGYENVYNYEDAGGAERWLRILEAPSGTGRVGIVLDVTKDIEEHRRLAHELDYDTLTHLYNRTAFKREVYRMVTREPDKLGAMVFIDLDNLKYTNDTFGHDMGDRLIIRAGEVFRQFEALGGVVSRISGDEFAAYLHGYATREAARAAIDELFAKTEDFSLKTQDGQFQRIRFSAGIAYYPTDSTDIADLLKLSDYAMYEAKHSQKGSVFEFNQASYKENVYVLENREAINLLLDEKLIRFAFQPIVDIRTGEIFAYEALMRPLLDNFKSPLEILTVAANQSKLGQLEHVVMTMGFQTAKERLPELLGRKLFINSIPSQALSPEDLLLLERNYADVFDHVVIEITEAENDSPRQMNEKLSFIRKHGIQVAIDDFGSGYSNEVRILSMMPDIVKVDMALVSHIDTDLDKQTLVSNLVFFCKPKGIRMVAEGVERPEELATLHRLGMDYVQGFYLGRPAFTLAPISEAVKAEILGLSR